MTPHAYYLPTIDYNGYTSVIYFTGGQSLAIDTSIKAFGPASHLLLTSHTENQLQTVPTILRQSMSKYTYVTKNTVVADDTSDNKVNTTHTLNNDTKLLPN